MKDKNMRQVCGLSSDGKSITLHKFDGTFEIPEIESNEPITAIILDIETTGLEKGTDKIIDLAYLVFKFEKSNRQIIEIKKEFSQLEDPEEPLSDIVKHVTKYRDEDLKGKKIDWDEVTKDFSSASIIIAHNAEFDRAFLDRYLSISREKIWACSAKQICWKEKGHASVALECLAMNHGFFFDSHNAIGDAKATLKLLIMDDPDSGKPYLAELLSNASIQMKRVAAQGAAFEFKDELRKRGYRFDYKSKIWSIITSSESDVEEDFIRNNPQAGQPLVHLIPRKDSFKTMN
jgi:DNA polymerase-3 subunit epsilon